MTARLIPVEPFDLVVFGGTGDLAMRKLLPGLYHRDVDGQIAPGSRIIGVARSELDREAFAQRVEAALRQYVAAEELPHDRVASFLGRLDYVYTDVSGDRGWDNLARLLPADDHRVRVFYLATAADLFGPVCQKLAAAGLATEHSRVVLEKPIGRDLESARAINTAVGAIFDESQIFRIDHYLGKETVQNLMALRFANSLFEPLWNQSAIDHVQITVSETVGLETRAAYYDKSGALRDMVQNHILQLLCLVAMEPPSALNAQAVRDEKIKVLRALVPITGQAALRMTVRGQYRAGAIDGAPVRGYLEDLGEANGSRTETFVAIKAEVATWRWAGVPFYLRTGKRLAARLSEIAIQFKAVPHSVFERSAGVIEPNRLIIRLQPDEGVKLVLMSKDPGPGGMRLRQTPLNLSFAETFKIRYPDAYERLLLDVVRGNATLFMRKDEVEAAWRWIDPILASWADADSGPQPYAAGSWGPSQAIAMVARDDRSWLEAAA
jgi:glucose-6-phosphate 1-dehydrogenase